MNGSASPGRKLPQRLPDWWPLALLTVLMLGAIVTSGLLARSTHDKWFDELWLEIAKAGVGVVAVGVLGGALAFVWQNITARRDREIARRDKKHERKVARRDKERERELEGREKAREREIETNDKMRAELASLVGLYNDVKSVRRKLRSLGLDSKTYPDSEQGAEQAAVLTAEQALGFHAEMLTLSRLQLGFEAKAKQFGQTDFLADDTEKVVRALGRIEEHLNSVIQVWEQGGWMIREGTELSVVFAGLERLFRVREYLRPEVSNPMREITTLINRRVFSEATDKTKAALKEIDSKHEDREAASGS